uniref:DNA 5'-3' helicase n=1 Tax=Steinernema glaseri TaxID=37863 RepID=A0A1I8AK90_9BILA
MYRFLLLNPAEKLKDLVKDARSVLLIGGTMEPAEQLIDAFERVCEVPKDSIARFSCGHVVGDDQLTAISLARGPNGQDFTLTYANRSSPQMISSIGMTFSNMLRQIPNGVVAFFASYDYMANFTSQLKANGMYDKINNIKPIFVEKRGTSAKIWNDFQRQAKTAKGAMLCAVVGGKLSEGINFSDELGRCVFMIGLPYPNKNSVELQEKMKYLDQHVRPGAGSEHYEACCMHSVNQAIGRAIRHRNDYAAIVLLDARYGQPKIREALPKWISGRLTHCTTFPQALQKIVGFFRDKK